jgi:hypothetical protein
LRAGWGLVYGQTPVLNYFNTALTQVGWNTLTFATSTFGTPFGYLKNGLQYDPALLTSAAMSPGATPNAGTPTSPPAYLSPQGGRPPRINQWNVSIQRELFPNLTLEAGYVGNRSVWILANNTYEPNANSIQSLAAKGYDISQASVRTLLTSAWNSAAAQAAGIKAPWAGYPTGLTVAQALRPFPQFGNIGVQWMDNGDSWYDAAQVKLTKRTSHGLTVFGSFSWQKELEYGINMPNDVFNKAVDKSISAFSQPEILAIGYNYKTPGVTSSRLLRDAVKDWNFGGFLQYAAGLPIESPCGQNNLQTLLFQSNNTSISSGTNSTACSSGTFMNRIAGQPLFLKSLNDKSYDPNKDFVLNPAAWSNPAAGTFGTAANYYNDYRFQRHPVEQMSLGRIFRIKESVTLEFRAEFYNVFNRRQMADPVSTNATSAPQRNAQGVPIAGFGYVNAQSLGNGSTLNNNTGLGGNPRQGQLLLRFRF